MRVDYLKALGMCEELHEKAVRSFKDEVSLSTDEELDSFIKIITEEKDRRKRVKCEKLFNAFEKAWKAIEAEGYDFYIQGEPLDYRDVEIY